jgi:hypothetical protein
MFIDKNGYLLSFVVYKSLGKFQQNHLMLSNFEWVNLGPLQDGRYFSLHESLTSLITSIPAQSGLIYRLLFYYYHVCPLYNIPRVPYSNPNPLFSVIST